MHHTELIASLLKEGKIKITRVVTVVLLITIPAIWTVQRYLSTARQILKYLPDVKLIEMENNKKRGFCCGGGAQAVAGRAYRQRISENRIDQ